MRRYSCSNDCQYVFHISLQKDHQFEAIDVRSEPTTLLIHTHGYFHDITHEYSNNVAIESEEQYCVH